MAIEALLFDVDGTLSDTEREGHRPAFNQAFEQFGLDWHWDAELYGKLLAVTGGKERIRYYVEHFRPSYVRPANFDGLVNKLHTAKTRHYTTLLAQGLIPMRPGVKRLLQEARAAGLRLAVVTTTTPENVTSLLRHSLAEDAETWFEVIAAGDIVPAKKPAPDIYHWAMREMNLTPQQCLAFEDSRNGLISSLEAGIRTLVTVNGYTAQDNFDGALAVLSDLGEPDAPFKLVSGETYGKTFVDVSLLKRWCEH
ncbi:MAG TPA: HAD family hydrolase [Novimethylophilus sp.]|uniref:HAD family hydrolase n=1 Tax=Novimethylophilus sp. TaxID=2137426 RepID=UPI002F3E5DC0